MISDDTHTGYNHHKITEIERTGCANRENRREASPGRQERTTNRTTIFTPIPARAGQDAARSTRKMSQNQMKKRLRQKRRLRQQGVEQAVTQIGARGAQIQVRRALDSLLRNDIAGEDYRSGSRCELAELWAVFRSRVHAWACGDVETRLVSSRLQGQTKRGQTMGQDRLRGQQMG